VKRIEFSRKTKAKAKDRAGDRCELCGGASARFEFDHILAAELGGEATLENCQMVCVICHRGKTTTDIRMIRKSDRIRDRKSGALKSKKGFRGWKLFDGTLVWREDT
jgi:5-methylcytosine-specific restriction endonuclease McrA